MNKFIKNIKCNLCGNNNNPILFKVKHFKPSFFMVKCTNCGLVYMNPRPSEEKISAYYNEGYYSGNADYSFTDERKNMKSNSVIFNKRLSVIEKYLDGNTSGSKKILDIGCSFGGFLVAARKRGWETYGIEVSEYSANHAIDENELNVQRSSIETANLPADFYDAIVMVEVIEHLADPLKSLQKIYRSLKKGGMLIVQTANADSFKARISGAKWEYFLPGHLYCFSRKTLSALLRKTGFRIEKIYTGDELGILTKLKSLAYSNNTILHKIRAAPLLIAKHFLRKIAIGNISIGGNIFYSRKT